MIALARALLAALCAGIFLGAVYDTVRISRIFFGVSYTSRGRKLYEKVKLPLISKYKSDNLRGKWEHNSGARKVMLDIIVFIGDVLFCFFAALVCVVIMYHTNDGKARWIIFFGMALGFSTYYFTLGRLVMLFSEYIVFALRCVFCYIVFFISLPMRFLYGKMRHVTESVRVKRYTKKELKRILNASKIGFIG